MRSRKSKRAAVDRAVDVSAAFHGFEPRRLTDVSIDFPAALVLLGLCAQVDYISDKWDERVRRYFHEFDLSDKRRPCLLLFDPVPQSDGSRLLIVKGHFNVTPEGIVG